MRVDLQDSYKTVTENTTITHAYHIVDGDEVKHEFVNRILLSAGQTIGFADNIIAYEQE